MSLKENVERETEAVEGRERERFGLWGVWLGLWAKYEERTYRVFLAILFFLSLFFFKF